MNQSDKNYDEFQAEGYFREKGTLIGDGRCGGKAKGLAYAKIALFGSPLGETVSFPDLTVVLSTEVFDDHINGNGLSGLYDEEDWETVKRVMDKTPFSDSLKRELGAILDRFDTFEAPPLAIRSSSLLEDSISLAFAGKYETCFSANCGAREDRLKILERGVRSVFTSLFNPSARAYREKHNKPHRDESIAVIIQSLSGKNHGNYFYPELAGTLFSRVFRRPNPRIKKEDGVMRLCFGLGTRTVDRCAARTFYLTNPSIRPAGNLPQQVAEASQEYFDYIDREHGTFLTGALSMFVPFLRREHKNFGAYVQNYGDNFLYSTMAEPEEPVRPLFSFPELHIKERALFNTSKDLLKHMEATTGFPVDIEFTYETEPVKNFRILQMRPLTSYEELQGVHLPDVPQERIIFRGDRMVSNGSLENVTHLVYVDASLYKDQWDPSAAARAVGEINKKLEGKKYILAGPGRWGSRNPALGVPIIYAEICNCGVLVEISVPELNFSPELSFGTHFFLDMDSDGILYLPVFGKHGNNIHNMEWLDETPYTVGEHPSVRVYEGNFSVYLDGEAESGLIILSA
ncbi:MAG: PEP/pyruvate-binding domain-containing protein [Synergistaceae bacterium]|nr:PEP/pyruvate-binding domain-containing protein [Synergistaceae bacterium]